MLFCTHVIYEETPPAEPLRHAIASYWRFVVPAAHRPSSFSHVVPPDGLVNLCWLPSRHTVLVGPRTTALQVPAEAGCEYRGVRFVPGAAAPLLDVDVPSTRDQVIPFDRPQFEGGIEGCSAVLLARMRVLGWPGPDPAVVELTRRIIDSDGSAAVSQLLQGLGLSYRQLLRRFHRASGLTPKEFARLRRMRSACLRSLMADASWVEVSAAAGFADQPHLTREFKHVYGWTPRLTQEYLRRIEHRGI